MVPEIVAHRLVVDVLAFIVADEDTAMEKCASSVEEDEIGDGPPGIEEVASSEQILASNHGPAQNRGFSRKDVDVRAVDLGEQSFSTKDCRQR